MPSILLYFLGPHDYSSLPTTEPTRSDLIPYYLLQQPDGIFHSSPYSVPRLLLYQDLFTCYSLKLGTFPTSLCKILGFCSNVISLARSSFLSHPVSIHFYLCILFYFSWADCLSPSLEYKYHEALFFPSQALIKVGMTSLLSEWKNELIQVVKIFLLAFFLQQD